MKKIPKRLLWQLDVMFYLTVGLLFTGLLMGQALVLVAAVLCLGGYVWVFLQFKCPHCRRNIMPWVAAKARREDSFCPNCGFKLTVE